MTNHRWRGTRRAVTIATALLAVPGCASLPKGFSYPSADLADARVTTIGFDAVGLEFDLDVTNPYGVELPLTSLDYELATRERPFFDGTATLSRRVPAGGTTRVTIPVRLPYRTLLEAAREIGETHSLPYRAVLGLHVTVPMVGDIRLPMEKDAEIRLPGS